MNETKLTPPETREDIRIPPLVAGIDNQIERNLFLQEFIPILKQQNPQLYKIIETYYHDSFHEGKGYADPFTIFYGKNGKPTKQYFIMGPETQLVNEKLPEIHHEIIQYKVQPNSYSHTEHGLNTVLMEVIPHESSLGSKIYGIDLGDYYKTKFITVEYEGFNGTGKQQATLEELF